MIGHSIVGVGSAEAAGVADRPTLSAADAAMARYGAGDDAAFAVVYDAVAPSLERYLLRHTHNPSLTEDLLQQTFLKLHRHRGNFLPGSAVMPWAFAIALRLLIDRVRRRRREALVISETCLDDVPAASHEPAPDQVVATAQMLRRLEDELVRLPTAQRRAFEMVRRDGLSLADAARTVGTTATGLKLRLFRATRRLRASLQDEAADDKKASR